MTLEALKTNAELIALAARVRQMIDTTMADSCRELTSEEEETLQALIFGTEATITE